MTEAVPGVLLMTYGSPSSLERADVATYLAAVRGGRAPDDDLVEEFTRRYRVIGGSPLVPITREQGAALEHALGWPVAVGMRFSAPGIVAGLSELRGRGVTDVAAIVLSPQVSPLLMRGYGIAVEAARASDPSLPAARIADAWHLEPAFLEAVAERVCACLAAAGPSDRPHVLMTAHSLPRRVAEQEPAYLDQLRETATAIAGRAGLGASDWTFCWQSAGHEPGEWMTPDFADLMPVIAQRGGRGVLVVPVQFLADHLETLYDVDVGAREQADAAGIGFERVPSLNADPGLVLALSRVARRTLAG